LKHGNKTFGLIALANKASGYDSADKDAIETLSVAFVEALMHKREETARKRAEETLKESEKRFRGMADTSPLAIYMSTGLEQKAHYINPRFIQLFGYTIEDVPTVGHWWPRAYPDEKYRQQIVEEWQDKVKRAIDTSSTIEPMDVVVTCKDGSTKNIIWGFTFLGDTNFAFGLDVTERKRAEEELMQRAEELARSNAELEQFAYIASHDLQEPLRMVASYTQLLGKRYKGKLDGDADEFISFAVEGANRMQRLINDLLTYSRVGTRGQGPEPIYSEQVLDEALATLQLAITESAAQVTHDPLPKVLADGAQLGQVFQNLIGNALKYRGDAPPRIHISAAQEGDMWVFSVRDNGIGIDPDYHERVFVIFQRLHTREEGSGTGMGLAVCKKIVERHGGRIWLESELGKGATFYFTIPAVAGAQLAA
jgi:PAS domain S-box-containing protein